MIAAIIILSLLLVWAGIALLKRHQARKKAIAAQRAKLQLEIKRNAQGFASDVKKEGKKLSALLKNKT